jgi:hypothetical protein
MSKAAQAVAQTVEQSPQLDQTTIIRKSWFLLAKQRHRRRLVRHWVLEE